MKSDQLDYLQRVKDRQVKAYELVRQEDYLIKSRHEVTNEHLEEIANKRPKWKVGD